MFILVFVSRVIAFHSVINNFLTFILRCCIMNHPWCGDCAFSASFGKECTDVSYVAGEGVGLTVHKESDVIEEIKEVELRSRHAQFIYDRNYNRNAAIHLADFR